MLTSQSLQLRVGVDVGTQSHSVAVGLTDCSLLEAFEIPHTAVGFEDFFTRIERYARRYPDPIAVAMESYNGHVRPQDSQGARLAVVGRYVIRQTNVVDHTLHVAVESHIRLSNIHDDYGLSGISPC